MCNDKTTDIALFENNFVFERMHFVGFCIVILSVVAMTNNEMIIRIRGAKYATSMGRKLDPLPLIANYQAKFGKFRNDKKDWSTK